MQQLRGLDASFLYMETPSTFGHVSSLGIFDPSTAPTPADFDEIKRLLEARLHLVPPLRRRLVEVPFGLDHPYWIEDPDFDIDYHVREIALPAPGDRPQLAEQTARIVSRPLDRSRPLWEMYVISGLEDGHVAVLTKMHHSAIDGVSGAEVMTILLDLEPEPREVEPPDEPWTPEAVPSSQLLFMRGVAALTMQPLKAMRFQRRALEQVGGRGLLALPGLANLGALGLGLAERAVRPPRRKDGEGQLLAAPPLLAPRTPFNRSITSHRRVAFGSYSLDDAKAVKNAYGTTVNDVIMAMCSGALRRWLLDHEALPEAPLMAMVPVSTRTDAQQGTLGNQVSAMIVPIATDVDDPVERLRAVHEAMRAAKEDFKALPAALLQEYPDFSTPALAARAARAMARTRIADRVNPPFNVTISNVPGPPIPLYSAGARMVAGYPVSAIADGVGLNMTVMSYMGSLDFGLVACRELVPDLWTMVDGLGDSLDELKKAAEAEAGRSPEH